jgi:hypothetical protein
VFIGTFLASLLATFGKIEPQNATLATSHPTKVWGGDSPGRFCQLSESSRFPPIVGDEARQ